jgi:hypothetical protein
MSTFPKGCYALVKADRKATLKAKDEAENAKARKRANGRCECFVIGEGRCLRRDTETHHLLDGWRFRGRGKSALMIHKQRLCLRHHREQKANLIKLVPTGMLPVWFDAYERVE